MTAARLAVHGRLGHAPIPVPPGDHLEGVGCPEDHFLEQAGHDHPIEKVGKELRAMMPWISAGKQSVAETSGGQGM
mgnify:CR=1 FL=1